MNTEKARTFGPALPPIPAEVVFDRGSVALTSVTKIYEGHRRGFNLRAGIPWGQEAPTDPIVAIDDLDLEVPSGSSVALIGPNGAGKTTLLQLVAGVTAPTDGAVSANGKVGSLIELGVGFHPELTGWQNLRCSARLLGLDRRSVKEVEKSIADFAGIGDAMNAPVRTYSSGMVARLGFAVATSVPCDVLVVDEVLAVGDQEFRDKCFERIRKLRDGGTTLLFVTHQMPLAALVCERAIHLRGGQLVDDGPSAEVIRRYIGGSPANYQRVGRPAVTWTGFRHPSGHQESAQPLVFDGEIEVKRAAHDVRWSLELRFLQHPDYVFASDSGVLAAALEPGRYRLRAKGSPLYLHSAHVRAEATLMTTRATRVMDTTATDVAFEGPVQRSSRPRFSGIPRWLLNTRGRSTRSAGPKRDAVGSLPCGPPRVRTQSLRKVFAAKTDNQTAGQAGWRRRSETRIVALNEVSVFVNESSALGVIGGNGAGKSTFLGTIAGTVQPDTGVVETVGRVIPLLGLGLGFHPDLTGRENLEFAALLLGLTREELDSQQDAIERFTQFGEVLERPVRTYSSGMEARLGVALALHASPDVLLIDEVLSVGDQDFRNQSLAAVRSLCERGTAALFVSHELDLVTELCERTVRISRGELVDDGKTSEVLERYGAIGQSGRSVGSLEGIVVSKLDVVRQVVPTGEEVEFSGSIEVIDPSESAWVELRYVMASSTRSTEDAPPQFHDQNADELSIFRSVVERPGGALALPGNHEFECVVPDNFFRGEIWVVVAVLDARPDGNEMLVAQGWHRIRVGPPTDLITAPLDVSWTLERLVDESLDLHE